MHAHCSFLLSLSLSLSLSLCLSSWPTFPSLSFALFLFVRLQDRSYLYLFDIVSPRSVPDLFFFCLNLVAIRGGHTPRQGRVCTRAPIESPSLARANETRTCVYTYVRKEDCGACTHADTRLSVFAGTRYHGGDHDRPARISV